MDWVGGVLLVVTDNRVRLGWDECPTDQWVGGVLLVVTDHIQGSVGSG
jgi:hypothetical protein